MNTSKLLGLTRTRVLNTLFVVQMGLVALLVGLALFSTVAHATETGTWAVKRNSAISDTGGNVTTVQVDASDSGKGRNGASWSLDNPDTMGSPVSGTYSPDVTGQPALALTYNPGRNNNTLTITFQFSNPVTDPVLHIDKIGEAFYYTSSSFWTLDTAASNGATSLTRLSGVGHFLVDNNQTFHGSFNDYVGSNWSGNCQTNVASGAACGSVRINGTFTTLVFDVQEQGFFSLPDAVSLAFTFNQDLGDAPSSYGRALHAMPQLPNEAVTRYLGANPPDDDANGNEYSAQANHDDTNGTDDEDGVTPPDFTQGQTAPVTVSVHEPNIGTSYLQGWIDWNQNKKFDAGEQIATNVVNNGSGDQDTKNGTITLSVTPPSAAAVGTTIARFRWSSKQDLGASDGNGEGAPDGEVEDYVVKVLKASTVVTCPVGSSGTGGGIASGGSGAYRGAIYWLDWDCGTRSQFDAGSTVKKTWDFGPVEIRATLRDLSAPLIIYNTGTWQGDLLDNLYSGVNPIGLADVSGQEVRFAVDWEVYLNGQKIAADIIAADAEDTDDGEFLDWRTDGDPWQIFAVAPNSDLQVAFSNGARDLRLSSLPGDGSGSLLAMSEDVGTTSHVIHGSGVEATAFGVFVSLDYGDLPEGYPESGGHFFRHAVSGGDQPTNATDANTLTLATVSAKPPYLGIKAPDAESGDQHSANADADGPEEDGVTFPTLNPGGTANLTIKVTEDNPGTGYLEGWIDWNHDSDFADADEQVALNVRDNGPQDTNPAVGVITLPVFVPPGAVLGTSFARFRFSDSADVPAGGFTVYGGEIEDDKITIAPPVTGGVLAGRVFSDNGSGGGSAHNGVRDGAEAGLAGVKVRLLYDADGNGVCDGSEAVIAEDTTGGDGAWRLVPLTADVGKAACLVTGTPAGYRPVSENNGGHAALVSGAVGDNSQALTVPAAGVLWDGIAFGDVPLPLLQADGQGTLAPGGAILYPHRFTAGTVGRVDFAVEGGASNPANPAWTRAVYRDANCDGRIDGNDAQAATSNVTVAAGDQLCLLVRVFAPANAPVDARDTAPLVARQALAGTTFQDQTTATDRSRVVVAQLSLEKTVRNLGADGLAGTTDDGDASAGLSDQAAPGDVLRYTLRFTNPGSRPLTEVTVHDSTPGFTSLAAAATCPGSLPTGLTGCSAAASDGGNSQGYQGSLSWTFSGQLAPGASGELHYDVRVNP